MKSYNIAIIGGGASGFAAAIGAMQTDSTKSVVILERMPRVLKKVLATGNGTCNMSNKNISIINYHGNDTQIFDSIYSQFDLSATLEFFKDLGIVHTVSEDGRIYPMSKNASSVVDALRYRADSLGCDTICDFEVLSLEKEKDKFIISSRDNVISADSVIVATGGCSQKNLGSNGSGYDLLCRFGHKQSNLFPSITAYKTEKDKIKSLRGIKLNATLSVVAGGNTVHTCTDELLFTEYGLSGSVIFKSSRKITENLSLSPVLSIDFLPQVVHQELAHLLNDMRLNLQYLPPVNLLFGLLPKMVSMAVVKEALAGRDCDMKNLTQADIEKIAAVAKSFKVKPLSPMGFDKSQVTSGGIITDDFDKHTLESKLVSGLYATGEVLDIDGDCGGYNLQWAWSSGYVAGKSAAKRM